MLFERTDYEKYSVIRFFNPWLDFKASKELKDHFAECRKKRVQQIIVDLSTCEKMTSEGIGLLLYMWQLYQNDGKLLFVITSNDILSLLKECGIYAELRQLIFSKIETAQEYILNKKNIKKRSQNHDENACPTCNSLNITLYDRGLKGFVRFIKRKKKRYICNDCYLVWRYKK